MEIGSAEIIENLPGRKRKRPSTTGRPGSSGGGGGGGGGGDNPDPGSSDGSQDTGEVQQDGQFRPGISRILTGFLLLVVMMTFGGLIAAYIVIATNNVAEWRPFNLPIPVWISTTLIILSSFTYQLGKNAIDRGSMAKAKKWLLITTAIGAMFISSQLLAWVELTARGLYMSGNPYAGFFFILTAVHAVHVLGGIIALGAIVLRTWSSYGPDADIIRRKTLAEVVGWYWHFMGLLWIVIFILLGYWK